MKIVICGNYGAQNWGDEMILEGLIKSLRDFDPALEITILSGNPKETEERFNVKSLPKFPAGIKSGFKSLFQRNKTGQAVKESDLFILGGGGLFSELTFHANLIWLIQGYQAIRLKKPIIMHGQSVGTIKNGILRWLVKKLFNKALLVSVRDEESQKRLSAMGVRQKIQLIPDLAFGNPPEDSLPKKNRLIIALREYNKLPTNFVKEIAKFASWLKDEEGQSLKFINFQADESGDEHLHGALINKMQSGKELKIITPNSIEEINQLFAGAKFAICMRLHSAITSIKTATPFIAISYAHKVRDLLKSLSLEEHCLDLQEVSFEKLKKQFLQLKKDHELVSKLDILRKNLRRELKAFETNHLHKILQNLSQISQK